MDDGTSIPPSRPHPETRSKTPSARRALVAALALALTALLTAMPALAAGDGPDAGHGTLGKAGIVAAAALIGLGPMALAWLLVRRVPARGSRPGRDG